MNRRKFVAGLGGVISTFGLTRLSIAATRKTSMLTVCTFGDSILDCGRYNDFNINPGQLLVRNNDKLFPEFRGRDLTSISSKRVQLLHRAVDGATVDDLPAQAEKLAVSGAAVALLTIGGNDLIAGLAADDGSGIAIFSGKLEQFLKNLPIRPVLLGTVYDPTFGDDNRNFLNVDPILARKNLRRMNDSITKLARRYGALVDLHAHFLTGKADWFTHIIEPSLVGASEVRRVFLKAALSEGLA